MHHIYHVACNVFVILASTVQKFRNKCVDFRPGSQETTVLTSSEWTVFNSGVTETE